MLPRGRSRFERPLQARRVGGRPVEVRCGRTKRDMKWVGVQCGGVCGPSAFLRAPPPPVARDCSSLHTAIMILGRLCHDLLASSTTHSNVSRGCKCGSRFMVSTGELRKVVVLQFHFVLTLVFRMCLFRFGGRHLLFYCSDSVASVLHNISGRCPDPVLHLALSLFPCGVQQRRASKLIFRFCFQ